MAKGLSGASVYLTDLPEDWKFSPPEKPFVLRLVAGKFAPSSGCVQVGQPLVVLPDDAWLHALEFLSRNKPPHGQMLPAHHPSRFTETYTKPEERVLVRCANHALERAWVTVVPNPWHATTAEDGTFRLPQMLPSGTYTLRVYHQDWGRDKCQVVVKGDAKEVRVELELAPSDSKN
jgi:hypothetical protein